MAEARLDFNGDAKGAQAAFDKLTKALADTREQVRKLNEMSRKGAKESTDATNDFANATSSLATKLASAGTVVAGATMLYLAFRSELDKSAAAAAKLNGEMVKASTITGRGGADLESFVQRMKGSLTPTQATDAFRAVAGASPSMGLARKSDLAAEVGRLGVAGHPIAEVGGLAGDIAEMMPGKSAGDIADIVAALRQSAGDKASMLGSDASMRAVRSLMTSGMGGEEALATMATGLTSDQKMTTLQLLAQAVTAAPGSFGGRGKSKFENQFEKMTPQERRESLLGNPALARDILGNQALGLGQISKSEVLAGVGELQRAQSSDFAAQQFDALRSSPAGLATLSEHGALVAEGQRDLGMGRQAEQVEQARRFISARAANRGFYARGVAVAADWSSRFHETLGFDTQQRGQGSSQAEQMLMAAERSGAIGKGESAELIATMRELNRTLKENNAATTSNTKAATAMPRINVNAHNE